MSAWVRSVTGNAHHFRPCGVIQPTRLPLMQEITGLAAVASERRRERSRSGTPIFMPPKHFERCTPLVWEPVRCNSGWGLQIQNDRSRTSVQAGVISQPGPGQHRGLRPFPPPCSSLRISFVKRPCRCNSGGRLQSFCSRSPTQRHDVENVDSAGASPAASTISACKH